jgi:ABC-type transporter Mla MlaB component
MTDTRTNLILNTYPRPGTSGSTVEARQLTGQDRRPGYALAALPTQEPACVRTLLEISGPMDSSRRPGLLLLADQLIQWGLDGVLVSIEKVDRIDSAGSVAIIEMLQRFRDHGLASHLAIGPMGMSALLAAARSGACAPLRSSVRHWMDADF